MTPALWPWVLTLCGVTCFLLAGRKIWWAWYVGLFTQALWLVYAIDSAQWGFLFGVAVYSAVYATNALRWTAERKQARAHC